MQAALAKYGELVHNRTENLDKIGRVAMTHWIKMNAKSGLRDPNLPEWSSQSIVNSGVVDEKQG